MNFLHHVYTIYIDRGFTGRAQSGVQRGLMFSVIDSDTVKHLIALVFDACQFGHCNQFPQ